MKVNHFNCNHHYCYNFNFSSLFLAIINNNLNAEKGSSMLVRSDKNNELIVIEMGKKSEIEIENV